MRDFGSAIGLVLVIEGVLYALFPTPMKKAMRLLLEQADNPIRLSGLTAAFLGLALVWIIRRG